MPARADALGGPDGQTYRPFELVAMNNASPDDSVEFVRSQEFPFPVRPVELPTNEELTPAWNRVLEKAHGPWVWLLSPIVDSPRNSPIGWFRGRPGRPPTGHSPYGSAESVPRSARTAVRGPISSARPPDPSPATGARWRRG